MSAAERASKASSAEPANEGEVQANGQTDERVAQYLRLYSCLFQTTVHHRHSGGKHCWGARGVHPLWLWEEVKGGYLWILCTSLPPLHDTQLPLPLSLQRPLPPKPQALQHHHHLLHSYFRPPPPTITKHVTRWCLRGQIRLDDVLSLLLQ